MYVYMYIYIYMYICIYIYIYISKISTVRPYQYLDYLLDRSFQGVNKFFVLPFEDNAHRIIYQLYFLPNIEI